MDRNVHQLPLDRFAVALPRGNTVYLERAEVEADGDEWGPIPIADAQARLEEADDLAILQLRTQFTAADELAALRVQVNEVGLRTLEVDGVYCVPAKGEEDEGCERYKLADPLPAGEHRLEWSYVWNPPRDLSTGDPLADGVTLLSPALIGQMAGRETTLQALPQTVDARDLAGAGLGDARPVELSATIDVPLGVRALHVQGPSQGSIEIFLDGVLLTGSADVPHHCALPPGQSGTAQLMLRLENGAVPVRSIRLL